MVRLQLTTPPDLNMAYPPDPFFPLPLLMLLEIFLFSFDAISTYLLGFELDLEPLGS